jgi:DNA-directed RNA polymerase specialized sigma24 family protein
MTTAAGYFQERAVSSSGSVTQWIAHLKAGDHAAAQKLWQRYSLRLVRLARARLRDAPRRAADEEDVVLSAFDSLCRGAREGRFPLLSDRDDLWRLLVVLTARKGINLVQHERRQKRGGGQVVAEADLAAPSDGCEDLVGLEAILAREPTPEFAAQLAEEYRRLLNVLGDQQLRDIATLKMQGYTDEEVAARLGCTDRTVRRRLQLIRKRWEKELSP